MHVTMLGHGMPCPYVCFARVSVRCVFVYCPRLRSLCFRSLRASPFVVFSFIARTGTACRALIYIDVFSRTILSYISPYAGSGTKHLAKWRGCRTIIGMNIEDTKMKDTSAREDTAIQDGVLVNVEAMLSASERGVGPDIVIVVSSSPDGADFWQNRLTSSDGIHGSGAVVKAAAIVLSVSESNWHGPAGNGLGTINAFYSAGRMAAETGIVSPGDDGLDDVFRVFSEFVRRKSVFMFHTAGKGTRLSPLTAAEYNSKSRIKLPGMIKAEEVSSPITVLEAAIRAAAIYAPSREGRLSVFWGDQVLLNELDVSADSRHHVEIFAQPIRLDENIKSYGILIPGEDGDCLLREKLSVSRVREMFPGLPDKVYRSVGSFSLSFELFERLVASEHRAVMSLEGALNTDNDWWQAITSTLEEYIDLSSKKGISADPAEKRWRKTHKVIEGLNSTGENGCEAKRMVGFKNTGENSLWMDYGRNSCLFENILLLTGTGPRSRQARMFFGLDGDLPGDVSCGKIKSEHSVIIDSRVGSGKLKNCVVVSSDIGEVNAEDSIIIGSDIIKLNSSGALCYNVASSLEELESGDILVNIFHPETGRIVMRTDIARDGQVDWKNNVKVGENRFSWPELAKLIGSVSEEDIRKTRDIALKTIQKEKKGKRNE